MIHDSTIKMVNGTSVVVFFMIDSEIMKFGYTFTEITAMQLFWATTLKQRIMHDQKVIRCEFHHFRLS